MGGAQRYPSESGINAGAYQSGVRIGSSWGRGLVRGLCIGAMGIAALHPSYGVVWWGGGGGLFAVEEWTWLWKGISIERWRRYTA